MPTIIDRQQATITVQGNTLDVTDMTLTMDRSWSPYVQGTVTIAGVPPWDPRDFPRVLVSATQWMATGKTADEIAALFPGQTAATIQAGWAPRSADTIAALYMTSLTPGGSVAIDTLTANLFLTSTEYDVRDDLTTLTVHSDEARAFLLRLVSTAPLGFGSLALRTVVGQALERIGANLSPIGVSPTLTEPAVWQPRATLWEFLEPLCTSSGARLWCDEGRVWHLDNIDAVAPGQLTLSDQVTITDATPTVDLDGDWCDSVVVEYRWRDALGATQSRIDVAGVSAPYVTASVVYDNTVYPGPGAAQVILTRRTLKGRTIPLRAVNDFLARPSQVLVALVSPLAQQSGLVQRVSWTLPEGLMAVDGYGFEEVSPMSVRAIPGSYETDQLPGLTKNLDPRGM